MPQNYPPFPRFKSVADKGSDVAGRGGKTMYEFEFKAVKVFHMKNFYKFVYWWLIEEGWRAAEDESENDEYPETFYEEWRFPEGHMERRIWWRLVYNPEFHARGTSRHRYYVDLNFKNLWLKNVDTVVGGRRVKAQEGEVEVKVKAYVKIYDEEINKNPLFKYFYYFFRRRWYKQTFEGYRDDLRMRMRKFQDAMKDFFNIATYEDDQKNFHLERGL